MKKPTHDTLRVVSQVKINDNYSTTLMRTSQRISGAFVSCCGPDPKVFLAGSPIKMLVNRYAVLATGWTSAQPLCK